jgi:hypothetical protein
VRIAGWSSARKKQAANEEETPPEKEKGKYLEQEKNELKRLLT